MASCDTGLGPAPSPPDLNRPADFDGRLLAEAIRQQESLDADHLDDAKATNLARRAEGDLEQKIVTRARATAAAPAMQAALRHFRLTLQSAVILAMVLAIVAGAATAQTAIAAAESKPVNFHWALLCLIGVETLTLILWLGLAFLPGSLARTSSLGGFVVALSRRVAAWFDRGGAEASMVRTAASTMLRGAIGRWGLGAISHGFWLSYLIGATGMILIILSAKQVSFVWETTILSEDVYLPLTNALAFLPKLVGFSTPSPEAIVASRWTGSSAGFTDFSGAWSGLLIGCLVLYGMLPRLVLLCLCLMGKSRAQDRYRLDLSQSGFLRLRTLLMPEVVHGGIVDPDISAAKGGSLPPVPIPTIEGDGPLALFGYEVDPGAGPWPPALPGVAISDLGLVDGRQDRARVLAGLGDLKPRLTIIAVSLLTTPDRGVRAFLEAARQAATAPMMLLLTDIVSLQRRQNPEEAEQRIYDWRQLGASIGIPPEWAFECDLADPNDSGLSDLHRLICDVTT